jgi:hypothetical protein
VAIEVHEMVEQVLRSTRVHERMEPRQQQHAAAADDVRRAVENEHAQRRRTSRVDGSVELVVDRLPQLLDGRDRLMAHGRRGERAAPIRRPVQLAPRPRSPQTGRRPRAEVEKSIEAPAHTGGIDGPVAMDNQHGVAARHCVSRRMQRQQHEIGAAQGEPMPRYERPRRRQM